MIPHLALSKGPYRLLVVEDDVLVRAVLAEELHSAGFKVVQAGTADEALSYLMAGGNADLVFSDIQMPGRLNGIDLARRLEEDFPSLPVILTSSNYRPQDIESLRAGFIPKPYNLQHVIAALQDALNLERDAP